MLAQLDFSTGHSGDPMNILAMVAFFKLLFGTINLCGYKVSIVQHAKSKIEVAIVITSANV